MLTCGLFSFPMSFHIIFMKCLWGETCERDQAFETTEEGKDTGTL